MDAYWGFNILKNNFWNNVNAKENNVNNNRCIHDPDKRNVKLQSIPIMNK